MVGDCSRWTHSGTAPCILARCRKETRNSSRAVQKRAAAWKLLNPRMGW